MEHNRPPHKFLLVVYLTAMVAIFGTFIIFVYYLFARNLKKQFDRNWQLQEQFTTNFSHHLRNLLTKIGLSIELMLAHSERFQTNDARKLEKIETATKQMQRLVDDLLYLIRTDTVTISPARSK
jgi:signal transduction histidine kinase